jgi:aminopeptidase O
LGLASPNLIFLSQSLVLNGDTSMLVRVAHEVSHAWFGLVIGALDWTEQWLSEVRESS